MTQLIVALDVASAVEAHQLVGELRDRDGPANLGGHCVVVRRLQFQRGHMLVSPKRRAAFVREERAARAGERLTLREQQVAKLISDGLSNKLIADKLGLSEHTAKYHVNNVCMKYGTTSRVVVAVKWAVAEALGGRPHALATPSRASEPEHA